MSVFVVLFARGRVHFALSWIGNKKALREGTLFFEWRWRESNPRPKNSASERLQAYLVYLILLIGAPTNWVSYQRTDNPQRDLLPTSIGIDAAHVDDHVVYEPAQPTKAWGRREPAIVLIITLYLATIKQREEGRYMCVRYYWHLKVCFQFYEL